MQPDDYYQLGYIVKPHGLQGELNFFLDVDFPEDYQNLESVFLLLPKAGTLVPFFVEHISIQDNKTIVKFEDINSIEQAEDLIKAEVYLPLNQLPTLTDEQYYYHEIIGFTVQDKQAGTLGIVKDVYGSNSQDLIAMEYKQQEVLIPIADDVVLEVNKAEKLVITDLPEGLLDIYLT